MVPIQLRLIRIMSWIVAGTAAMTVLGCGLWGPPLEAWLITAFIASAISCALFEALYRGNRLYGAFIGFCGGLIGGFVGGPLTLWIGNRAEYMGVATVASAILAALTSTLLGLLSSLTWSSTLPRGPTMKRILFGLTILLFLVVMGVCVLGPFIQKWPIYQGRSIRWHWGLDLHSRDPATRSRAAAALSEALDDDSPTVRRAAASALGAFGWKHPAETKVAVPALRRALTDEDEQVRVDAKRALKNLEKAAKETGIKID